MFGESFFRVCVFYHFYEIAKCNKILLSCCRWWLRREKEQIANNNKQDFVFQFSLMHFGWSFSNVDTAFISWNCMLDVDVSVRSAAAFQRRQSVFDDVCQAPHTVVVDAVQHVHLAIEKQVQHGEKLAEIRDESLTGTELFGTTKGYQNEASACSRNFNGFSFLHRTHLFQYHVHLPSGESNCEHSLLTLGSTIKSTCESCNSGTFAWNKSLLNFHLMWRERNSHMLLF